MSAEAGRTLEIFRASDFLLTLLSSLLVTMPSEGRFIAPFALARSLNARAFAEAAEGAFDRGISAEHRDRSSSPASSFINS